MDKTPLGVKIISILYCVMAFFIIIAGLAFLFGNFISDFITDDENAITLFEGSGAVFIGSVLFFLGVLYFLIGRGIWLGENWARIAAIILALIGIFSGFNSLFKGNFQSLVPFAISLVILIYLLQNSDAKKAFS